MKCQCSELSERRIVYIDDRKKEEKEDRNLFAFWEKLFSSLAVDDFPLSSPHLKHYITSILQTRAVRSLVF